MPKIKLTKGYYTEVDQTTYDLYGRQSWHYSHGYAAQKNRSGVIYLHKLIIGDSLDEVDHIDGDKLNNRRSNLRFATHSQNNMNKPRQSNNTTGFKGVHKLKSTGKYQAYIKKDGKRIHLGTYSTAQDAARAYVAVAEILFKEFKYKEKKNE